MHYILLYLSLPETNQYIAVVVVELVGFVVELVGVAQLPVLVQ